MRFELNIHAPDLKDLYVKGLLRLRKGSGSDKNHGSFLKHETYPLATSPQSKRCATKRLTGA